MSSASRLSSQDIHEMGFTTSADSGLLRGFLRVVGTRFFQLTASLLFADELEHVFFGLYPALVLDLLCLARVNERLFDDVPSIAVIFVGHLAAARVAHRHLLTFVWSEHRQPACCDRTLHVLLRVISSF